MRGLNTELTPDALPQGAHAQFRNASYRGGEIRPRGSHVAYEYEPGSFDAWALALLGIASTEELDFGEELGIVPVSCPLTGGQTQLWTPIRPIALPAPTGVTMESRAHFVILGGAWQETSLANGLTISAAYAWYDESTDTVFGLSDPATVTTGCQTIAGTLASGTYVGGPGEPISQGSITGILNSVLPDVPSPGQQTLIVTNVVGGVFAAGSILTGATFTFTPAGAATERALEYVYIQLPGGQKPETATHLDLYLLDAGGVWRRWSRDEAPGGSTSTMWGMAGGVYDTLPDLPAYPGPTDAEGLVEALGVPPDAQLLALHKGSLVLACDRYLYVSEPYKYRWFIADRRLDMQKRITGLVSRGEYLECFTAAGVKLLVGDYPTHYLRETQIKAGPRVWSHLAAAPVGTFVYVDDAETPGLYRLGLDGSWQCLTDGWNTPWLKRIEDKDGVVLGADDGTVYVCDPTADTAGVFLALALDWRLEEWFEATFPDVVSGFRYSDEQRFLVAKISDSGLVSVGTGSEPVDWIVELPEDRQSRWHMTPRWALFDADGEIEFELVADGLPIHREPVWCGGEKEHPLPESYSLRYQFILSGTGTAADTYFKSVKFE